MKRKVVLAKLTTSPSLHSLRVLNRNAEQMQVTGKSWSMGDCETLGTNFSVADLDSIVLLWRTNGNEERTPGVARHHTKD